MIAIVEAYRSGLLKAGCWLPNILSGLIVGVVALPLAMAFAIASGVLPEQGLYTAIIAGLIVALLGGCRSQIAGPTGAFIAVLANITAQYGVDGLQIATFLAGLMLVFMGFAKIGNGIKYIPTSVIVGFTSGIAVIIFVGEWKDFLGLSISVPLDARFHQKFFALITHLNTFSMATTLLAVSSLFLVVASPKLFKKIPGPLIAMVFATVLQAMFHFDQVATLGSVFGGISQHLPHFHLLPLGQYKISELMLPALTVALLGAIESLLSATVADRMAGTRHHSNQELIGQGLANMVVPFFGGFAATGALARTATNVRNGGNSPISAIMHSLFLVLVIVLLAPLAVNIPLCALAAILFVVAYNMSEIPHFIRIIKENTFDDIIVLWTTFTLTIFTDLVIAVTVGIGVAIFFSLVQRKGLGFKFGDD